MIAAYPRPRPLLTARLERMVSLANSSIRQVRNLPEQAPIHHSPPVAARSEIGYYPLHSFDPHKLLDPRRDILTIDMVLAQQANQERSYNRPVLQMGRVVSPYGQTAYPYPRMGRYRFGDLQRSLHPPLRTNLRVLGRMLHSIWRTTH